MYAPVDSAVSYAVLFVFVYAFIGWFFVKAYSEVKERRNDSDVWNR